MPLLLSKPFILPLAVFLLVNLTAVAWRAIPPSSKARNNNTEWQSLQAPAAQPDVRELLKAGKQWGEYQQATSVKDSLQKDTPEATQAAITKHIASQLQGIVYRGEWVLLFTNPAQTDNKEKPLPLELKQGNQLPNTDWQIGQIWADRIELLQTDQPTMIIPLYPIADTALEL